MQEIGKFKQAINVIPLLIWRSTWLSCWINTYPSSTVSSSWVQTLDKLVNYLPAEIFKYTSETFQGDRLKLMTKKGVYPYEYMDGFEKFTERR